MKIHPNWKRVGKGEDKRWELIGQHNCEACRRVGFCKRCGRPFSLSTALEDKKDFCSRRCEGGR
jgi:hypothetical protein